MKKYHSDTEKIEPLRDYDEYPPGEYSEYNNTQNDRYDTRYYERYDDRNSWGAQKQKYTNSNNQRTYFGKTNRHSDYYEPESTRTKGGGRSCSCAFGCCLGAVVVLAVLFALFVVMVGGFGSIADVLFRYLF